MSDGARLTRMLLSSARPHEDQRLTIQLHDATDIRMDERVYGAQVYPVNG